MIEAGVSLGLEGLAGDSGLIVSVDGFGKSAPMEDLRRVYGFDPQAIASRIKSIEKGPRG